MLQNFTRGAPFPSPNTPRSRLMKPTAAETLAGRCDRGVRFRERPRVARRTDGNGRTAFGVSILEEGFRDADSELKTLRGSRDETIRFIADWIINYWFARF